MDKVGVEMAKPARAREASSHSELMRSLEEYGQRRGELLNAQQLERVAYRKLLRNVIESGMGAEVLTLNVGKLNRLMRGGR